MNTLFFLIVAAWGVEPPALPLASRPVVETAPKAAVEDTAVTANLVLKVASRDEASALLVKKTEESGGYFQAWTPDRLSLRVPIAATEPLLAYAGTLGVVADRGIVRSDLSSSRSEAEARLKARRDMLDRYLSLLSSSHADAIVTVESQVVSLVSQIEGLEGQLRVLSHQAQYAVVEVAFQFRDRAAPGPATSSSFRWMNTLSLPELLSDFHWGEKVEKGPHGKIPEGFAAWKKGRGTRASSPDGVVYRLRTERQRQTADLSFWKEALERRMVDGGYHLLGSSDIVAGDNKGFLLELVAPVGSEDYTWMIAVFPDGKKIHVGEVAGEVSDVAARREAILAALTKGF